MSSNLLKLKQVSWRLTLAMLLLDNIQFGC